MRSGFGGHWMAKLVGRAWLLAACSGLTGCNNFFVCAKSSCTNSTSSTTTNTGDFAYISNSASGQTYVAGYDIGSGALTAITGSPFALGYVPVAMKVSPNNSFLFVGSGAGGIYRYTISSAGVLAASGATPLVITTTGSLSSIDISPDGDFLFAMDTTGLLLSEYQLNSSTGALTVGNTFTVPGTSSCALAGAPVSQSCTVAVSPLNTGSGYVAVALGAAGTVIFPYTSSGGITTQNYSLIPCCSAVSSPSGDFSLVFDSSDSLYIARTVALSSYGNVGNSAPTFELSQTYASGVTPRSLTVSTGSTYLYTANEGNGTISGFGLSGTGTTTALAGSPYVGPTNVSALGADSTGTYLIAAGYNSSTGVQLFKPGSGVLGAAVASAGTGTNTAYPALLALTH